jgi:hypothetical protein
LTNLAQKGSTTMTAVCVLEAALLLHCILAGQPVSCCKCIMPVLKGSKSGNGVTRICCTIASQQRPHSAGQVSVGEDDDCGIENKAVEQTCVQRCECDSNMANVLCRTQRDANCVLYHSEVYTRKLPTVLLWICIADAISNMTSTLQLLF